MTLAVSKNNGIRISSHIAFPMVIKRQFSTKEPLVITDSFIEKYDQFRQLPIPEKIQRLTERKLNTLLESSNSEVRIEKKWRKLQSQYEQKGRKLVDYDFNSPDENLKRLLLLENESETIKNDDEDASITTQKWAKDESFQYPLEGEPTIEHRFISQLLPKYVRNKTALIGVGTWSGNETFYFLRTFGEHKQSRHFIHYVANIEVNRLNARLANVVAEELDLNVKRFKTIEGNALKQLPTVPTEIATAEQTVICTRFVPTLTQEEIGALISQIRNSIDKMPGYAILTYSTLSLQDWEKPHTIALKYYLQAVEDNMLRIKTINSQNKELLGVSFIALIDDHESKLVAGATYQTFLFKEKVSQFFAERKFARIEQIPIGVENFIHREAAILISGE